MRPRSFRIAAGVVGVVGVRPSRLLVLAVLVVGAGLLALPQPAHSAGCRYSKSDCASLNDLRIAAEEVLDTVAEEEDEASAAERYAERLSKENKIAAKPAWRDAVRARVAGREVLYGLLWAWRGALAHTPTMGLDPAARALYREQAGAVGRYLGQQIQLWDWKIAQALQRVKSPYLPAVVNEAREQAVARADKAARASAAAVAAAIGPGRHPWPPVTDDAGLRDLWTRLGAENAAVVAGFDRLVRGLTGGMSAAERKMRAEGMAVLLDQYRATWKVMLSRLNGAKGLTSYAGCRSGMIDHAKGLRARDRLIVRLIGAVRNGDAAAIRRALAAQRAQGAKNRQLAAKVRACLKAAGPPTKAPGTTPPPTFGAVSEKLCPARVTVAGRTLPLLPAGDKTAPPPTGPIQKQENSDGRYQCRYLEKTPPPGGVPLKTGLAFEYGRTRVKNRFCDRSTPPNVLATGGLYSTSHDIEVWADIRIDNYDRVRREFLASLEAANIGSRC